MLTPFVVIPGLMLVLGAFYLCHDVFYKLKFSQDYIHEKSEAVGIIAFLNKKLNFVRISC